MTTKRYPVELGSFVPKEPKKNADGTIVEGQNIISWQRATVENSSTFKWLRRQIARQQKAAKKENNGC